MDHPAVDRLRQQVDAGPVVELGAERRRPEHERDQRQDDPNDKSVERQLLDDDVARKEGAQARKNVHAFDVKRRRLHARLANPDVRS